MMNMTLCGQQDYPLMTFLPALICDGCQMVILKLFANCDKTVIFSGPRRYWPCKRIVTLRREFLEKVEKRRVNSYNLVELSLQDAHVLKYHSPPLMWRYCRTNYVPFESIRQLQIRAYRLE